MTRIAILGANGQVGAELCLLLSKHDDVEVVPVCRNRFGSAFLRYHGVRCRHGLIADPAQARELIGDCDVIVNLALATGGLLPRVAREVNRTIIEHCIKYAPPRAKIIYSSSRLVYGDSTETRRIRWRNPYGQEKLKGERDARRTGRREGREIYILRLGVTCGDLQDVTACIREQIEAGPVIFPAQDRHSDTVYTATIADAVLVIAAGKERPGTYDLMNKPQWSWREVYEYEAGRCGLPLTIEHVPTRGMVKPPRGASRLISFAVGLVSRASVPKQLGMRLASRLSPRLNRRILASSVQQRARQEIARLTRRTVSSELMLRRPVGRRFMESLTPTIDLLRSEAYQLPVRNESASWPED